MTLVTTTNLSPYKYTGRSGKVVIVGIHTMEATEAGDTAENVAEYFKKPGVNASAHWCVDNNSRVRCVQDMDTAWTMPPLNGISVNVEMAGYAGQDVKQWADAYSQATLENVAICVAEWCRKYEIPVRHLTDAQIAAKKPGIAGHADVNRVFKESTHWDPGPDFPWENFLARVTSHMAAPLRRPDCTALQRAVHASPDNMWGPDTDKHTHALICATPFGGRSFPYGIKFTQLVVGAAQDGWWGVLSKQALDRTVTRVQQALKAMGFTPGAIDGDWGANTNRAYEMARKACHIPN